MERQHFLLLCLLSWVAAAGYGADPAAPSDQGEQRITKEFYPDGTIKTITRHYYDGRLFGTLYHTTNGMPTHLDYYDNQKRVRRTLLYRADGTAHTSQEFDEQHRLMLETTLDGKGQAAGGHFYFQQGRVVVHSPALWRTLAHKLDGSQDIVGFNVPNAADEDTKDSANISVVSYDLSHATNRAAFADRRSESARQKPKPASSNEWVIYTFRDKQNGTRYEIRDAYRSLGDHYAVYVRLAFPELPKTTKAWRLTLEADFKRFLETIETRPPPAR